MDRACVACGQRIDTERGQVLFMESPSSLSFELHDFAALARQAAERGAVVIADNTYAPSLLRPLDLGANVSLNAATKYIGQARVLPARCPFPRSRMPAASGAPRPCCLSDDAGDQVGTVTQ